MRKIFLDTETTGLSFESDRIFEIGMVEVWDYHGDFNYGEEFHYYINPNKRLSAESVNITGMSDSFLVDKPFFEDIVDEFLEFIGRHENTTLVAHNVQFDVNMINAELKRCKRPLLNNEVIDTLVMARKVYPTGNNSLDSLCSKLKIKTDRSFHGALKDSKDLSVVYYYLKNLYGGLNVIQSYSNDQFAVKADFQVQKRSNPSVLSDGEINQHVEFCKINNIV